MPQIESCYVSGLPLGYMPRTRVRIQAHIAFSQFTWEEVRKFVVQAATPDAEPEEKKFAFCSLLFQIPAPLLHLHAMPRPDWTVPALARMLEPQPLRNFAACIEAIRALPPRFYIPNPDKDIDSRLQSCLLPAYSVSTGYHATNNNLHDFPAHLNRWISILQSSQLQREEMRQHRTPIDAKEAVRAARQLWATPGPRKMRNEKLSVFDARRSDRKTIDNYARQLAAVLEREPTKQWLNLVAEPWFFHSSKLEQLMLDVRAVASGEEEFLSPVQQVCYEFITWLDAGIIRARAQEEQARHVASFIQVEEISPLLAMDVSNAADLLRDLDSRLLNGRTSLVPERPQHLRASSATSDRMSKMRALLDAARTQASTGASTDNSNIKA